MRPGFFAKIKPHASNQARHFAILARMTNQPGSFVDHEEIGIFADDFKELFHTGILATDWRKRICFFCSSSFSSSSSLDSIFDHGERKRWRGGFC